MATDFENPEAVKQIVICNTKFAFNLYKELISSSGEDGNFVVSPFAISVALAGAYFGAREETANQIKQAMKLETFDLDDGEVQTAFGELVDFILNKSPNCNFSLFNGIFAQEGFPYEEEFEEGMKNHLQVELHSLDFGDAHEQAMAEINILVENFSGQQIKEIMHSLDSETLLAMVNVAIYKGQWLRKFDKSRREFNSGDAIPVKTSFLSSTSEYSYVELESLQAEVISIPYINNDLSLIVVLPKSADGLAFTEQEMTGDAVDEVVKSMSKQRMHVAIPKFRLEFGLNLEDTLRKLAINDIFELGTADLSGVDGTEAMYVKKFTHRTLLEIAEEGEAGAPGGSVGYAQQFVADHPFLYFVQDNRTETILLMGR